VHGVSTRKVDDLIATLGISESEVSWICAELDSDVAAFSTRDLGERGTTVRRPGPDPPEDPRRRTRRMVGGPGRGRQYCWVSGFCSRR
jgi:hypothetical protein